MTGVLIRRRNLDIETHTAKYSAETLGRKAAV